MLRIEKSRLCDNSSIVTLECFGDCVKSKAKKAEDDGTPRKIVFYILPEDYILLKPEKGEADAATEAEIIRLDEKCRAQRTAVRLLEYSKNTSTGLVNKLRKRGFSKEASDSAAAALVSQGEIDEKRDIRRDAELCIKKGRGRKRVIPELKQKGYSDEALKSIFEYLDSVDFAEICASVIRKKYREFPKDPDEKRKAIASLMRLGFSSSDIKIALSK